MFIFTQFFSQIVYFTQTLVNLAARLESANKGYNTELMISESTYSQLSPHKFKTRFLDEIQVKGKSRSIIVFEVCDETSKNSAMAASFT